MPPKLTLDALEVLDAIERKGSFAAAAAALYRVPSAVTYTVQKLEEDIGVTLFRKEGRRSILTDAGRVLLEQGRELLSAADRLVETTRQIDRGWESSLNIAVDSIFPMEWLFPYLSDFYQEKSDIDINLYEEVLGGAWESVIDGRADLVLGALEPPNHLKGLAFEEIARVDWVFAVAADHPLTKIDRPLTDDDLLEYRAVVVRDSSRHMPPLTRRVFERQSVIRLVTMAQKIDAQCRGIGVGYLPRQCIHPQVTNGSLRILPMAIPVESTTLHMVWKSNNSGRALRWFIERFQREAAFAAYFQDSPQPEGASK